MEASIRSGRRQASAELQLEGVNSRYFTRSSVLKAKKIASEKNSQAVLTPSQRLKGLKDAMSPGTPVRKSTKRRTKSAKKTVKTPGQKGQGTSGTAAKKAGKKSKAKFFTGKRQALPRLGFKSTRRKHLAYPDFKPPASPYSLVQEELYQNPWQLLIATIFLNRTTGTAAIPVLHEFFRAFPNPSSVLTGENKPTIAKLMQPLGLYQKRADIIYQFSKDYVTKDWEYPAELFGIGKYGNDSYRIFCCGSEWLEVTPTDHMLNKYYDWLSEEYQSGSIVMDQSWYPKQEISK